MSTELDGIYLTYDCYIDLFGTAEGSEQGRFIIYIFGMIPHEADDYQYALVAEREDKKWKLKYKNEDTCSYQWCFISLSDDSDRYAIQWCPIHPEDAGSKVVMCLEGSLLMPFLKPPRIGLTDLSESGTSDIPHIHYFHNFHSIKS